MNKNSKRNRKANGYKVPTGKAVNSSKEREKSGKKRYSAPTLKEHPISGLAPSQMPVGV